MTHLGQTGTNPSVGCIVVKDGTVVGRGVTAIGGRPHAEPQALAEAGAQARGATAYVTLEPCSHHGKTPPCANALIASGVARVVVAVTDPDPRVSGKVTINTYGEIKPVDVRQLLETILRMNNAVMVQVGDLYRIVPAPDAVRLPISPRVAGADIPANSEEVILNLIFLKYASVNDMKALIDPFLGEGKTMIVYEADSPEATEALMKADPFHAAGVFLKWTIRPWKVVFHNPKLGPA